MSKAAIGLGVVGIVLAIVALVGPWWTVTYSMMGISASGSFGLFSPSGTVGNATAPSYSTIPTVGGVFTVAMALTVLGLILGVLLILLVAMGGSKPGLRKIGGLMGILGFVFLLIAPLYVMSALTGAMDKDMPGFSTVFPGFFGSTTISVGGFSATYSWGGGFGWYLAIVAGIVLLIGAILAFRAPKPAMAPPAPMPMMAPEGQMPPPPPQ